MHSLVIENDAQDQRRLVNALDEMHIAVEVADTSDAALTMLTARRFDLTVLDMEVPGPVSGLELARKNRPRMGTILIGEGEFTDAVTRDRWAAPIYYLRKPVDYCLFISALRVFSEQERLRREVAGLQRELKRLRERAAPDNESHEVDDLWFRIFDRLHGRREA